MEPKSADPLWTAKRPKWFLSLCSLASGEMIAADIAIARGYTIADEQALVPPEAPKALAPVPTPPRPAPPANPPTPVAPKAPPRPLPAPVAAVPPRPVAYPAPASVVADRARALTLIVMTAKGAEAEAECQAAIRSGATVEQYAATVAARSILDAMGKALRR